MPEISEILEVIMIVSFGASWPMNVMKSWKARTTKGKSLAFLCLILFGYVAGITFIHGLNQLAANGQELTWENYIAAMESAPMHVPMGGDINYAGGDRLGITALALNTISLTPDAITGAYALQVVSPIMSMDDVWAAIK